RRSRRWSRRVQGSWSISEGSRSSTVPVWVASSRLTCAVRSETAGCASRARRAESRTCFSLPGCLSSSIRSTASRTPCEGGRPTVLSLPNPWTLWEVSHEELRVHSITGICDPGIACHLPVHAARLIKHGGYLVVLLMTLSILTLAFILERLATLRRAQGRGDVAKFARQLRSSVHAGQIDEAIEACRQQG